MRIRTLNRYWLLAAPAGLIAAAGVRVLACDNGSPAASAPVQAVVLAAHYGEEHKAEHVWSDGKTEIKIVVEDGKATLYVNGKEAMSLSEEDLLGPDGAQRARDVARQFRQMFREPPAAGAGETPRVMIGITMATAEEARADLPEGVDPQQATVVTRVVKDLPADKAGLKDGDVIVRVDGKTPAAPDDIRRAIRERGPGEEVRLTVVRDRQEKEISVRLEAFDAEKLGSPRAWIERWRSGEAAPPAPRAGAEKELAELREQMAKLSAELERLGGDLERAKSDAEREKIGREMGRIGAEMSKLGGEMARLSAREGLNWFWSPEGQEFSFRNLPRMQIERGDGQPRAWVFGGPRGGEFQERLDKLDERLNRLEKLLEKMAEEKKQ